MTSVKDSWKKVGQDLSDIGENIAESGIGEKVKTFGKDFGRSMVKTVKHGIKAVSEWADTDDEEPGEAPHCEPEEAPENEPEEAAEDPENEEPKKPEIIYD